MKNFLKSGLTLLAAALVLSGCNCFKSMVRNVEDVKVTCTPEVLTLKGNSVTAMYTVTFPEKYFDKKAMLKFTPVLINNAGEELAAAPEFAQGEKVSENYTVISKANGGSINATVVFPYDAKFKQSKLVLRVEAKCANDVDYLKVVELAIAEGISTVQQLANNYAEMPIAKDNFQRVTTISQDANIMFLINKFNVRSNQLNSDEIKALQDFIIANNGDERRTISDVYTKSYASPDGPLAFNNKLSQDRGRATQTAVSKKFKKDKMPVEPKFDVEALGEDWEGFKELVENSNIQDKELILQVLQVYGDPEKRDQEIKNMSAAFEALAEKILPELRRSKLVVNVDVQGKTDEELKDAVNNDISSLNLEEMLFAATLFEDNATKVKVYKAAADKYNDARAWNNYAVALVEEAGKMTEAAKEALAKAAKLDSSNSDILTNVGVVALSEGNLEDAKKLFAESEYNKGLVAMAEGNYADAAKSLKGYNRAVAEVCNGNLAAAKTALEGDNSAEADYLRAVIAAREGNATAVKENLAKAISKNPELEKVSKEDVEFAKFQ
jgi:hypothetical protein